MAAKFFDSLLNFVSGLGTAKDKSSFSAFQVNVLSPVQLEAAYRGDWIARKTVNIPAQDATREWRNWQASQDQIEAIEAMEKFHGVQQKQLKALTRARLYGGSVLAMGFGDNQQDQPLNLETVTKEKPLKYLHVMNRYEIASGGIDNDISSPYFGTPKSYHLSLAGSQQVTVHPSRIVRYIGSDLPSMSLSADGWGDSILQAVDDAVKNSGLTQAGIANLVHEAKIDIIQIPDFMKNIGKPEYAAQLTERFTLANVAKSTVNALLLDEKEKWTQIERTFSGLPDVLKIYLLISSGAADIPATRFLSQSAVGLGATGEGDLRNYYDSIKSEQQNTISPAMATLDEVLIRSALGSRPKEIYYNWTPLWQLSDAEKSDISYKKAQTFKVDVDAQVLDADVLKKARVNQLIEDGVYPGLDAAMDEAEAEVNLNENDPNVIAQFNSGSGGDAEVQKQALNGTQITSLQEIAAAVGTKDLPAETAKALIAVSFPSLDPEEIDNIIDPMVDFEAPKKPAPIPFGGAGPIDPSQPRRPVVANNNQPPQPDKNAALQDAAPRSLYVRRDVLNAKDIIKWAHAQGIEKTMDASQLHVTIAYSKTPVDWMKVQSEDWGQDAKGQIHIAPGGPRLLDLFGPEKDTIVLMFASQALAYRHGCILDCGASWEWPEYQPHISISVNVPEGFDPSKVEPYRGAIELGPEIFEEVKSGQNHKEDA